MSIAIFLCHVVAMVLFEILLIIIFNMAVCAPEYLFLFLERLRDRLAN